MPREAQLVLIVMCNLWIPLRHLRAHFRPHDTLLKSSRQRPGGEGQYFPFANGQG
jgi:hypothetical protein